MCVCTLEVPELLNGLREAMKKYVILESKLADLKETKQVVAQEVSQSAGEMDKELTNLDEISEVSEYPGILGDLSSIKITC